MSTEGRNRAAARIPRIVHQTWKDDAPPPAMAALARTWREKNPGWHYKLWTDADARYLVARCAPSFLPIYDAYPEPIMRVDASRYFLMFFVGGVYADLDFECLRSLDALVEGRAAILGLEPVAHHPEHERFLRESRSGLLVGNAFLASAPHHPWWEHVFGALEAAHQLPGPLDATGPFLLTRAVRTYRGPDPPTLLPASELYPLAKREVWAGALDAPGAREHLARTAFAVHHWHGSWIRSDTLKWDLADLPDEPPLHLLVERHVVQTGRLLRDVWRARAPATERPLVSALMVTRGRAAQAACAIACFRAQTWTNRELVIVDDDENETLARHVAEVGDPMIRYLRLPAEGRPLGELRNCAVDLARGEWVCHWDDDDLAHPERIEIQMAAARALAADLCVLQRVTLWWARAGRVAFSRPRLWKSSLLVRRACLPRYAHRREGEDTPVLGQLTRERRVALLDEPRLHVYVIHGANTRATEDFEAHWRRATVRRWGAAAEAWLRFLEGRLPIARTLAALGLPPRPGGQAGGRCAPARVPAWPDDGEVAPSCAEPDLPLPVARPAVLVLVPMKDAARHLPRLVANLEALDWPRDRLALAFLESDSQDGTFERLRELLPSLARTVRRVRLWKRDYGFRPSGPRWELAIQRERRAILARCRNELLVRALDDEEWVLWIDADVAGWSADVIQRLLAAGKDIVVPHCISADTGRTFDLNTFRIHPAARELDWRPWVVDGVLQPPRGLGRQYLGELRDRRVVEVDSVGACMLLVRADLHRQGVIFPAAPYRDHIESEGLAYLARDMGHASFGLPHVEVIHS
jgi:hypothetical protein